MTRVYWGGGWPLFLEWPLPPVLIRSLVSRGREQRQCFLVPDLGWNPGTPCLWVSVPLSAAPTLCTPIKKKISESYGSKTLIMPGHLVLVIGPSGPPELPVSLVHMALERREFSAALYLRDSEPPGALSTQALPPGALLWASRGHPPPCFLLRPQPRQRLSWSFQSLPTGVSVLRSV